MPGLIKFQTKFLLPVSIFALFISACIGKPDNNEAVTKALKESLESSNTSINKSSTQILHSIEDKTTDPLTREKAGFWFPKAGQIQRLSSEIFDYIEGLKKFKSINPEEVNRLYGKLVKHKYGILSVDSSIRATFESSFPIVGRFLDTIISNGDDFNKLLFKKSSQTETLAILIMLQNEIKVEENKTLVYCHNNIGVLDGHNFTSFDAIVGQSSTYVKGGQKVEIMAGIGSFSLRANAKIVMKNKNILLNERGIAVYSFRASKNPGLHYIPVILEFTDTDGKIIKREMTVEYTVAKECGEQ